MEWTLIRIESPEEIPDTGKFLRGSCRAECDGKPGSTRTYEVSKSEAYEHFQAADNSLSVWFRFVPIKN